MPSYVLNRQIIKFEEKSNVLQCTNLKNTAGVYQLFVLSVSGRPKPINRFCGTDPCGLLYIGRSMHLRRRLSSLWNMIYLGKARGHIAGRSYRASENIQKIAPKENLAFRFTHIATVHEKESELLRAYLNKFGEVPPLNAKAEFMSKM